jgi:hypothetical protein
MIDFTQVRLLSAYTHYVGNQTNEEELILSESPADIPMAAEALILDHWLSHFDLAIEHRFKSLDMDGHEVTWPAKLGDTFGVDKAPEELKALSHDLARKLYGSVDHPGIAGGYLHVVLFDLIVIDDELVQAIGVYKSETRDPFINYVKKDQGYSFEVEEGYPLSKLDKGALVLNLASEDNYLVFTHDKKNPAGVARYWAESFLNLELRESSYQQTYEMMHMAKEFVTGELAAQVSRPDQIDLLNKTSDYFKTNERFEKNDYIDEVFQDPDIASSFTLFKENYEMQKGTQLPDDFEISDSALRKQGRVFKSVLKLDKNFHIYIHGDRSKIERGQDADGKKYYKIYFEEEN